MNKEIVIIGAGATGLVLGYYLAKDGFRPVVIEKEDRSGGLSGAYEIDSFLIEHYYHYFLSRDIHIVKLLDELKLGQEIIWQKAKIGILSFKGVDFLGYLSKQGMRTCSSGWDFLKDHALSINDKYLLIRLYSKISSLKDITEIENITARDWITKICNRRVYERIFEPILVAKWGEERDRISASWLVARLDARLDFRKFIKHNEYAGYPAGSFQKIFIRLEEEIAGAGGKIIKNAKVTGIKHKDSKLEEIVYMTEKETKKLPADCVISSIPLPLLTKIIDFPEGVNSVYHKIEYQGVICACLGLKKSLSGVLNVVCLPGTSLFNGLVEHTNIVPRKIYNNQTIVYLFKYLNSNEKAFCFDDQEIISEWTEDLKKILPSFENNSVLWAKVRRSAFSEPLSCLEYSQNMPQIETSIKGLFIVGLSQAAFIQDLNNIIKLAQQSTIPIKAYLERD